MINQKKDLRTIIYEQNEIIEKLTHDNQQLLFRLNELQYLEYISHFNVKKTNEIFEIAKHNASRIIMKAIDFSYSFKKDISILLDNINYNRYNVKNILKIIDEFLERNKQIYSFSKNQNEQILEFIKKEIINKIK